MSLAALITSLSGTTTRLIDKLATDSFFVLRAATTVGKGDATKDYQPTTAEALPCFYSLVTHDDSSLEAIRATKRRPVVFYKFNVQAGVDITVSDRLRLVARAPLGQKDLEIARVADAIGLAREVIAIEEVPAS